MNARHFVLLSLTFTIPATPSLAQDAPKPGDIMIEKYLAAETDKLSKKFLDGAKTLDEWQQKRPRLYQEYMDMLGLWPIPEKTPLKATFTGTVECDGFYIDKLHYQSKPGLYVTANLYRPEGSMSWSSPEASLRASGVKAKKFPAVLYVCGHSNRGRDGNKTAFQDHGAWFAKNGYICLMLDSLQLGEIPGVHHGTYGRPYLHLKAYGIPDKDKVENRWWWHAAGYTPAGVECWNGVRGIDYLLSRPDVDAKRLAVTGISGGGAATFWVAAADDRVTCAVPVSGMSDLESYVKNKVINGHCDCMFLYNTYQWDWTTIAALVAPRPLLFANSDNDKIFPMDANRRIIAKLRHIYQMYGKPELVDDYVSKGGHDYRPDLRVAVFKWINKHVKNDSGPVFDAEQVQFPGKLLRVFREDNEIPQDAINGKVDETFVPRAKVELPKKYKFAEWKKARLSELREKVFRAFPDRFPIPVRKPENLGTGLGLASGFTENNQVLVLLTSLGATGELNVFDARGKDLPVAGLAPRGMTMHSDWFGKSPPNYVERSHILLGGTVDQGRVLDIGMVARWKQVELIRLKEKSKDVVCTGKGQAGILAAYAALFEPSIKEVIIIDPPTSHKQGPYFLNVLRVLDIPEALGLLAPNVKLTLINARDPAFDRTAELYRLAGAADKLVRK